MTRTASSINVLHCIIAHTAELPHIPIHLLYFVSDFTRRLCKHGNTQSIAERIAGKLQQLGKQVETRPLNVVKNPEHYEALATSQARMTYSWKEDHKMEIQITHRPSYALAIATLTPNETINVEPGAAVSFSDGVTVQTHAQGGFFRGVKRMFGGEHISPRSPRLASIPVGVERKASLAERVSCS